jgi:hypothetical protein
VIIPSPSFDNKPVKGLQLAKEKVGGMMDQVSETVERNDEETHIK